MFVDYHCHLSFPKFKEDYKKILNDIENDFYCVVESTINSENTSNALNLLSKYQKVRFTLGFHPYYAEEFNEKILENYKEIIKTNSKIIGIGEIGFDYKSKAPFKKQKQAFTKLLKFAQELNLPITIHNRGFNEEVLKILKAEKIKKVVFHCFSQNREFMKKVTDKGYYISFAGNITFKNAPDLRKAVKEAPLDLILSETDSPFLAPQCIRGKRNTPKSVQEIIKKISELKQKDQTVIRQSILENGRRIFNI